MTVTSVTKHAALLTMTIVVELDVPVQRAWQLWSDPRQLERWWGPPTYPATFVDHDLSPGGTCTYYMTGPEGDRPHGWWKVVSVDPPRSLEIEDGFAGEDGTPNPDLPVMAMRLDLAERATAGTTMTLVTTFASTTDMERVLEMGMEEGMRTAIEQMDAIVTED